MEIIVIDLNGNQRDLAYLRAKYGPFVIKQAVEGDGPVYKISHLLERADPQRAAEKPEAPATMVLGCVNPAGNPLEGQEMAFYWPDAPDDPNAGPLGGVLPTMNPNRCVHGPTGGGGVVGFGMGTGAYYTPPNIGPHAGWAHGAETRSDLILGLGMVAATNHSHFDVVWTLYPEDPEPPPPAEEIESLLISIRRKAGRIANDADEIARLLGYSSNV